MVSGGGHQDGELVGGGFTFGFSTVFYLTNCQIKDRRGSAPESPTLGDNAMAEDSDLLPEKLYRVSEIAEFMGISRQMVHLYVTMGILRERKRRPGGMRLFGPEVFRVLERVRELRAKGWNLRAIRDRVRREFYGEEEE